MSKRFRVFTKDYPNKF
uniref:Uncharacterized protein n=1 Tax=Rhizophora mucronata TaxID=61149 RepID=A0A2P2J4S4_RHIMU